MAHSDERARENHASFEIEDADKLLAESIKTNIHPMPLRRPSIFKVSLILREGKEDMYAPQVVSIGPFHRGKENLQTMEEQKKWYLYALLTQRSASLEEWVKAIREMEEEIRGYYAESIDLTSNEFVKMMLFDGCFILQLFYTNMLQGDQDEDDPAFMKSMRFTIKKDMILLENQIPYIVLKRLFNLTMDPKQANHSLEKLAMYFFDNILPAIEPFQIEFNKEGKHLLDLIRNNLIAPHHQPLDVEYYPILQYTYSATDLWEAGVDFKKKDNANGDLLDITFSEDGVLEIPPFFWGRQTKYLLQNLIAFEEHDLSCTSQIKSYVAFMDILINTQKDIRLLRSKGIMECSRDHEEVVGVVNRLGKGITFGNFCYQELCYRVHEYYKSDWHKWRATLKRDYFSNPWSIISVVAAFILLVLTFLQTLFSILSY